MAEPIEPPWVLVRKGRPPMRFDSRERAQRAYNSLRFNAGADSDAALYGPNGESWYCGRFRWSEWVRDDERRRRADAEVGESVAGKGER